ncbi:MAG: diaminopimelate epimerase [Candidatus Omnitrophica bacterium]|nr:diaminopimelate epimerase [Candidatus Omnitrophota bacterium]
MKKLKFTKMVASGNDFVVIDGGHQSLAKKVCDRKYGVGADGLLVLEKSRVADIRMRIFNADGSEAEMCGNGARCAALYSGRRKNIKIETRAGIIEAHVNGNNAKIKLTDPKDIKLDIPIRINSHPLKVNFINTGVPHTVIFVEGLDKIDVRELGRQIRYHGKFKTAGTNVDFVEVLNNDAIKIRTYERGVEDETLACGTGSAAAALIYALRYAPGSVSMIKVHTKGGEILKVYFDRAGDKFKNVWLEGKARIVYTGVYDV